MATPISARLSRAGKKDAGYTTFNSNSTALVSKLRQDGQLHTVENVMHAVEQVSTLLTSGIEGSYKDNILNMCQHLKVYGACLEVLYKDQLDRAFVVFRNSSQEEEKLDYQSRLHLLELIELRANQWKGTDVMSQYYKKKLSYEIETSSLCDPMTNMSLDNAALLSPIAPPLLGPGEIMKSSGKFPKPTRIPGKNYCKDEVVIRNADSGKVNPGAKERLVQITGANEGSINHAKQLIEDTIRRNASPIRDPNQSLGALAGSSSSLNSSASDDSAPSSMPRGNLLHSLSTNDASVGEYKYTVLVKGQHTIKITGNNLDLVRMSKIVLDDFFSEKVVNGVGEFYTIDTLPRSPLSPHESIEPETTNSFSNGQSDEPPTPIVEEEYKPLRRPNIKPEEILDINPEKEEYKPLRRPNIKPEDILDVKPEKVP